MYISRLSQIPDHRLCRKIRMHAYMIVYYNNDQVSGYHYSINAVPTILQNGTECPVLLNAYSAERPVKMLVAVSCIPRYVS